MNLAEQVNFNVNQFYKKLVEDPFGRYRSWEHCYYSFYCAHHDKNPDIDNLSLQLGFYLASWGMYRGSSFLLQQDYKIHTKVVEILFNKEYEGLWGIDCQRLLDEHNRDLIINLGKQIKEHYESSRKNVKKRDINQGVSDILVTKILMGTLGCAPAYDRYFSKGVKHTKAAIANFNSKSLLQLAKFYEENCDIFEETRKSFKVEGKIEYPQMKFIDMAFFQIGINLPK